MIDSTQQYARTGWIVIVLAFISLTQAVQPAHAELQAEAIQTGTYRVWVSMATDDPPFRPRPTCARFFSDGTVRLDMCPFSNNGTLLSDDGTNWTAITPCVDNLISIYWIGTVFNGSQIDPQYPDAISAVGIRADLVNGESRSFHGFRVDTCLRPGM